MPGNICTPFDRRRTNGNHLETEELLLPCFRIPVRYVGSGAFHLPTWTLAILARLNYDLLLLVSRCLSYSGLPSRCLACLHLLIRVTCQSAPLADPKKQLFSHKCLFPQDEVFNSAIPLRV